MHRLEVLKCEIYTIFSVNFLYSDKNQSQFFRLRQEFPYDEVRSLLSSEAYDRAKSIVQPYALSRIAIAQNLMGVMLENGWGGETDKNAAFKWYKQSSEQGFKKAKWNLATSAIMVMVHSSTVWFKIISELAKDGDPDAAARVGLMYDNGLGTEEITNTLLTGIGLRLTQALGAMNNLGMMLGRRRVKFI